MKLICWSFNPLDSLTKDIEFGFIVSAAWAEISVVFEFHLIPVSSECLWLWWCYQLYISSIILCLCSDLIKWNEIRLFESHQLKPDRRTLSLWWILLYLLLKKSSCESCRCGCLAANAVKLSEAFLKLDELYMSMFLCSVLSVFSYTEWLLTLF